MVKMSSGLLSLKWNHHRSTFLHVLANIRQKESYSDVTLACAGKFYPTHKLVLSTCSEYFEEMFERTQCKHPVIVLKDVGSDDLEALLSYMYDGEVNVLQENLSSLIKAAECLKIKGLAVADSDPNDRTREKKLHQGGSSNISNNSNSNNNNRDVQRNDRRPVNTNGSGIKRSNVNSGVLEDGTQPTKRRRPDIRSQSNTSISSEEPDAVPSSDDAGPEPSAAEAILEDGGTEEPESNVPDEPHVSAEPPEAAQAFIQDLNAEPGVKAEPVEVLDELGFDDRDDTEDTGAPDHSGGGDLPEFTEEKFSGGEGDDPSLWSGGDPPDIFSQPSTSNFGEEESNNDQSGEGKSGNTSSSASATSIMTRVEEEHRGGRSSLAPAAAAAGRNARPPAGDILHGSSSSTGRSHAETSFLQPEVSFFQLQDMVQSYTSGDTRSFLEAAGLSYEDYPTSRDGYSLPLSDSRVDTRADPSQFGTYLENGVRFYKCIWCQYTTARKDNLNVHIRRHTGVKPHTCSTCGRKFSDRSNFNAHVKRHHAALVEVYSVAGSESQ